MVLSLPPVPPELKAIAPYLQRADELASNDPVISYWCAYFAAQLGIGLKLKDSAARHFLFDLLGLLERIKTDLGANDAVHDEAASAAYIENFALRVFANADAEDRKGNSTRNTAKKFLAAANFLELLRIFDNDKGAVDLAPIEEKIKYAKWKAADIAKALREGRKPTPGPAATAAPEPEPEEPPPLPDGVPEVAVVPPPATPPSSQSPLPSGLPSPPSIVRSTPPPAHLTNLPPADPAQLLGAHLPDGLALPQPPQSPGSWSTAATPGTPGFHLDDADAGDDIAPIPYPDTPSRSPMASVSGELEGKTEAEIDAETTPPTSAAKSVHFAPSVVGGLGAPWGGRGADDEPLESSAPTHPSLPPHDSPTAFKPLSPPPPPPSVLSRPSHPSAPSSPATNYLGLDRTATVTMSRPELTPQVIARAQKHCRFAVSALDYEDRDQAIKELRAALKMLGG